MAQQKESLDFDFNQFTRDLLKADLIPFFTRNFNLLVDAYSRGTDVSSAYNGPTDEKRAKDSIEYYKNTGAQEVARLTDILYKLYSNPHIEGATKFYNYWNLMRGILRDDTYAKLHPTNILLFLNKLSVFEEETQFDVMNYMLSLEELDAENRQKLWRLLANNKYATPSTKARAAQNTLDPDIIRDAIAVLKQDLKIELDKDFPDPKKIDNICGTAKNLAVTLERKMPQDEIIMNYVNIIKNEFDTDKILALGAEYIPQTQQILEERLAKAEAQVKSAEKRANEAEQRAKNEEARASRAEANYNNEKQKLQQELQAAQNKSAMLTQEMDKMQQQLDAQNLFIKNLQMKMATLKTGLFGRGMTPEELQKWIAENVPQESR